MAGRLLNNKKQTLEARVQQLQNEINYYEKRIEEAKTFKRSSSFYDSDSSDSDLEFSVNDSQSILELKQQHVMLKTCYQATQELTDVIVVQSEVNILTEDPVIENEPPVTAPGLWKQVLAECRIDLVPFSITFYMHQGDSLFAPISYRALQVVPVKKAHEIELAHSTLSKMKQPSHAIEIIRSYAVAHRSRRTTLAKLAQKYADSLFMEPMSDGGYMLKCVNIMEISWTLQFKSHLAPVNHVMKFNLEYMDESYIKIITQANRQLSDPSINTDERTLLLAKIINTCLEAQKPTQELHESLQSDPESLDGLNPKTLDMDVDMPTDRDAKMMAPPKYVPNKTKKVSKTNRESNNKSPPNSLKENNTRVNSEIEKKSVQKMQKKSENKNSGKKVKTTADSKVTKIVNDKSKTVANKENKIRTVSEKIAKTVTENKNSKTTPEDKGKAKKSENKIVKTISENKTNISPDKEKTKTAEGSKSPSEKKVKSNVNGAKINKLPTKTVQTNTAKKADNKKVLESDSDLKRKKTALPVPVLKNNFPPKGLHSNINKGLKRLSPNKGLEPIAKKKALPVPIVKNIPPKIVSNKINNQKLSKIKPGRENIPTLANVSKVKK
ncbi:uncharacterized protein LOC123702424 [Colias croceus]|uniref:uncharacterized protein LOC123702424 n=1 Tax=Colias crocea TaxID=72248 RepID=UPI001E2811CE|nr:uncharacterized protein LOC123702424 [Colias croceus]